MTDVYKAFDRSGELEGWFARASFDKFVGIADDQRRRGVRGDILEIGCYHGKSACTLAALLEDEEKLYLCDLFDLPESKEGHAWEGSQEKCVYLNVPRPETVLKNVTRAADIHPKRIVFHKHSSLELPTRLPEHKFRIIHVDGRHDRKYALADIKYAYRALVDGGVIIVDDWRNKDWPEVGQAVMQILQEWPRAELVDHEFHKCYMAISKEGRKNV